MKAGRVHRWSSTKRDGRRFSRSAWRWAVSFHDPENLKSSIRYRPRTVRGHARTRRAAERAIERAMSS